MTNEVAPDVPDLSGPDVPEWITEVALEPIAALRALYRRVAAERGESWADEWAAAVAALIRGDD